MDAEQEVVYLPLFLPLTMFVIKNRNMPFCIHKEICIYRWFQHGTDFPRYSVSAATLDHNAQDYEKKTQTQTQNKKL